MFYPPDLMAMVFAPRGRAGWLRLGALLLAGAGSVAWSVPRVRSEARLAYELFTGRDSRPLPAGPSFGRAQRAYPRVRAAYARREAAVRGYFTAAGVPFPNKSLYFRAFKADDAVELWAPPAPGRPYKLVHTWKICARSGALGPKRREGDLQVPEGYYLLDQFNPRSNFELSIRINYPNRSDRILGDRVEPGGLIYIHGNCVTIGCLPMTDEGIREIYLAAAEAVTAGQRELPFHIFPTRMDDAGMARLFQAHRESPALLAFWDNLRPGFTAFEKTRMPPRVTVAADGKYRYPGDR